MVSQINPDNFAMKKFSKYSANLPPSVRKNSPPIPVNSKVKKMDKVDA
jgi:hypothetical protein